MIDKSDKLTLDLFNQVKRRGRPVTGNAKTDAERMRAYRQRLKLSGKKPYASTSAALKPVVIDLKHQLNDALQFQASSLLSAINLLRSQHAPLKDIQKKRNELKALRNKINGLQLLGVLCEHV